MGAVAHFGNQEHISNLSYLTFLILNIIRLLRRVGKGGLLFRLKVTAPGYL